MLNDSLSLAALIDALLRSPLKNRDAIKLITHVLGSGDFVVTPDLVLPRISLGKCKSPHRDEAATASPSRTLCPERTGEQCSDMDRVLTTHIGGNTQSKPYITMLRL